MTSRFRLWALVAFLLPALQSVGCGTNGRAARAPSDTASLSLDRDAAAAAPAASSAKATEADGQYPGADRFAKPGFVTRVEDGRLWVFRRESKELESFTKDGELAKHVVRPGAGPMGMTVKAPDSETIVEYLTAKPGFVTRIEDGRLWVFRQGSKELESFAKDGELAKHVVRPGAGPLGMTVKAPDSETIAAYLEAR